jgi:hypothetical protein
MRDHSCALTNLAVVAVMKTSPQDTGTISVVDFDVHFARGQSVFHHIGRRARRTVEGDDLNVLPPDVFQQSRRELPGSSIGKRLVIFGVDDSPRMPLTREFAGNTPLALLTCELGQLAPVRGELFGLHVDRTLQNSGCTASLSFSEPLFFSSQPNYRVPQDECQVK